MTAKGENKSAFHNFVVNQDQDMHQSLALNKLKCHGFVIYSNVAPIGFIEKARDLSKALIDSQTQEEINRVRSLGSLIKVEQEPDLTELAFYEEIWSLLEEVVGTVSYHEGIVFNKPPRSPATFWHQDFPCWSDPLAHEEHPHHLIALWYLNDTSSSNGCLRVIPGSHIHHHPLHDFWNVATDEERVVRRDLLRKAKMQDSLAFSEFADQIALPVNAGDLILMDSRLLHSTFANQSDLPRTLLSFWYFSEFHQLQEGHRVRIGRTVAQSASSWARNTKPEIYKRLATYEGKAEELPSSNIPKPRSLR
jgi:Phytanoyl-CoA dioxygenase (PhyH)